MHVRRVWVLAAATVLALGACTPDEEPPPDPGEPEPPVEEPSPDPEPDEDPEPDHLDEDEPEPEPALGAYGVAAGDPAAVAAGMEVLEAGGNAVDAAVATAFAVGVVEPFASGIGGGGATIVAGPDHEPVAYDYREVVAADGAIPASNTGVPGFVAGMAELHAEHGSLTFAELVAPAVGLARDGAPVSATVASQLRSAAHRLPVGQLEHFYPGGSALDQGAVVVQEDLAATLELIGEDGSTAFYEGEIAEMLVAVDGLDQTSLATYEVQRSTPPSGGFAGYEVVVASPPLPGVALVQMLQVAEAAGIAEHAVESAEVVHLLASSWQLADQSVSTELGDPDFVDVPVEELVDRERNASLVDEIALAAEGTAAERDDAVLAGNTTHLTVVDADGLMVSMTNTLTNFWGSGQYVGGFFLNDQLRRFSIGSGSANQPEPGRRSVSWSLPAMVLDDEGRPVLGIGSPGGRRIPNILGQAIVRWGVHAQSLEEVVAAPRFHAEGAQLEVEELPSDEVAEGLRGRGYSITTVPELPYYFGSVQALEADYELGEVRGARDTRRDAGVAVGP